MYKSLTLLIFCITLWLSACSTVHSLSPSKEMLAAEVQTLHSESLWIQNQLHLLALREQTQKNDWRTTIQINQLKRRQEKMIAELLTQGQIALQNNYQDIAFVSLDALMNTPIPEASHAAWSHLKAQLIEQQHKQPIQPSVAPTASLPSNNFITPEAQKPKFFNSLKEKKSSPSINESLNQIRRAIAHKNFKQLKYRLDQLANKPGLNPTQKRQVVQLKKHFNAQLLKLDNQADNSYQEGNIEDAIAIWRLLVTIDSNKPVFRTKLDRAQKVLHNLNKLMKEETRSMIEDKTPQNKE